MEVDQVSVDMASLTIEDAEEEEFVVIEDGEGEDYGYNSLCLVGRFINNRPVNFAAMKHTLASLMQPGMGMSVREVSGGLYVFPFYHKVDMNRVMDMNPWSFNNQAILLEKMEGMENPCDVPLNHVYLWVKVFGLRSGFRSEHVAKNVGDALGEFMEADPDNFVHKWREYWRVRVKVDINKPIKDSIKLKKEKMKQSIEVSFVYERIPTFCFICGIIGHSYKFCPLLIHANGAPLSRKFSPHLRDSNRRNQQYIGNQWLRDEPSIEGRRTGGEGSRTAAERKGQSGNDGAAKGNPVFQGVNPLFGKSDPTKSGADIGENGGILNKEGLREDGENKSTTADGSNGPDFVTINDPKCRRTGLGETEHKADQHFKRVTTCFDPAKNVFMVSDLISNGRWTEDVIRATFNDRDQKQILSIPLSRGAVDSLFWLLEKKGVYSVKSAYRKLLEHTELPRDRVNKMWSKLWNLQLPPNVKNFMWRAGNNITPTRDALSQRRVPVPAGCPLCNGVEETILHLMVDCPFAKHVWQISNFGWYRLIVSSFCNWMIEFLSLFNSKDVCLAMCVCNAIWDARNSVIWANKFPNPTNVWFVANRTLDAWKNAQTTKQPQGSGKVLQKWVKPEAGWIKINTDVATDVGDSGTGIAMVFRDDRGSFLVAKNSIITGTFSPKTAEAIVVKEVLSWLMDKSWTKLS
ncbi:hypothetical protein K2173_023710 [Erythroxylum novogranatense]|uniref:CCHC-type domain-containing protein n=1 Tax=Erythroxylum novogranatense TaxID=1862640 RepID=A0AAV8TPE1_9ROSI|nr:hypothetical protein K2173_023710 [Erythroxylum novogranatense]